MVIAGLAVLAGSAAADTPNFGPPTEVNGSGGGYGYFFSVSCTDVTTTANAAGLVPTFPPSPSTVGATPWVPQGSFLTYSNNQTVNIPGGAGSGQVYQYTASLITANGEVASIKQSDPFVLY